MKLAMLGLGDDALQIAKGLQDQGVSVVGFDHFKPKFSPIALTDSAIAAVADADVVFSLNSATVSIQLAQQVAPHIRAEAVFCDLNPGTPSLKKHLAAFFPEHSFADVAIMKPVAGLAEKVPLSISGSGAHRLLGLLNGLNLDLTYVSDIAGDAAVRNLIRSLVARGIAAVLTDSLWAASALGLEEWALTEIKREFETSTENTVTEHLNDTARNAKRRQVEISHLVEVLSDAGYESTMVAPLELTLARVIHGKRVPFANPEG